MVSLHQSVKTSLNLKKKSQSCEIYNEKPSFRRSEKCRVYLLRQAAKNV